MEKKFEKNFISPRNNDLLQSMVDEIVERICIMSEGKESIPPETVNQSLIRAIRNHGVKSNFEDYIVELLPMVDEAVKKLDQKQPEKKFKKGFSGLLNVFPEDKSDPGKVTIESLGVEITFRLTKDRKGKQKLMETSRMKPGSSAAGANSLRLPDELYKSLIRTAWAVLRDRNIKNKS